MPTKEIEVLNNLVAAGSGSKDLKLTDELLREHKLMPPLNTEGIQEKHIGVLAMKPVPSTFQVPEMISSEEEGQADMVNLNLTMPKWSRARSGVTLSVAPSRSSRGGRSEQPP